MGTDGGFEMDRENYVDHGAPSNIQMTFLIIFVLVINLFIKLDGIAIWYLLMIQRW